MKVVVVAGGTGGHIYPAVAIINKIKEKEKDSEFLYIGTNDRMEKDIIPKMGIKFVGLEMKGLSKSIIHDFKVMGMFKRAVKETKKIISLYYLLGLTKMIISALLVLLISKYINISKPLIKILVDGIIYLSSYNIQKKYIFKTKEK